MTLTQLPTTPACRRTASGVPRWRLDGIDLGVLLIAGGLVLAVGVMLVGPLRALILLALPAVAYLAWLAIHSPRVTVSVMAVVEVSNLAGVLEGGGITNPFRVSFALGLACLLNTLRDREARARLSPLALVLPALLGFYLLTRLITLVVSQTPAASTAELARSAVDCAFIILVALLVQLSGKPWTLAAAIVVPLAVLSLLALVNQVVFHGAESFGGFATVTAASGELITTLRQGGPLPDSNFWGRHLILGLPLGCALLQRAARRGDRRAVVGWAAALGLIPVGIYLTQSRGTYMAAVVVMVCWVVASGPQMRRLSLRLLPFGALLMLVPGVGDRFVALFSDVTGQAASYTVDPSVIGRTAAQQMAWAMFRDHPIFGAGPGAYPQLLDFYLGRVRTAVWTPPGEYRILPNAAHNLYAEIAGETGMVGLVGWSALLIGVVTLAVISVLRLAGRPLQSDGAGRAADRSLAAVAPAAVLGWSFASLFLHLSYFRTFGLILALVVGMAAVAGVCDPAARGHDWGPDTRTATLGLRRAAAIMTITTVVGGGLATAIVAATAAPTSVVKQQVTLLPPPRFPGYTAYALDVRTRVALLPTYAEMMVDPRDPLVHTEVDVVRGTITLVAEGDSDQGGARVADGLARASERLRRFGADRNYVIQVVTGAYPETGHRVPIPEAACAGGLAVVVACLAWAWTGRPPRRLRRTGRSGHAAEAPEATEADQLSATR